MKEILDKDIISLGNFTVTAGNILNAIIILIVAYLIFKSITLLITRSFNWKTKDDGRYLSVLQLIKYLISTITIVLILQTIGVNITFLVASSAAFMVGIGLGLQNVFKDFVSGVILLLEGTIKVNDIVELSGMIVRVKEISLRTSKVTSREEIDVIIPNHKFIEDNVINWTHSKAPTRFGIEVGIDYSSDIKLVEEVLIQCALSHKHVIKDEVYKPKVRFNNFGDSSLEFQLFFYSHNLFRIESTKSQLRFLIFESFRKNDIKIPFPQRVIHTSPTN